MDAPLRLDKNDSRYDFDKIVLAYYHQLNDQLKHERTNHIFSPFGCDFAFVDAKVNYQVIQNLTKTWNDLGFGDDIELVMSTPTRYLQVMKELNKEMVVNATNSTSGNATNSTGAAKEAGKPQDANSMIGMKAKGISIDTSKAGKNESDGNSTANFVSFQQIFSNMSFAVNETYNAGWPVRRDDGFPYQERTG